MLSPEDVNAVVEALMQTPQMQWVSEKMQADAAADTGLPDETLGEPDGDEPLLPPPAPAAPPAPPAPPASPEPPPVAPDMPPAPDDDDQPEPVKYSRLRSENDELRGEVARYRRQAEEANAARVNTERRATLDGLRRSYAFDVDEEMAICRYGRMSDGEFAKHADRIRANYREVLADNAFLPTPDLEKPVSEREKFSRQCADQAERYCLKQREAGKDVNFKDVYTRLMAGEKLD